MNNKKLYYISNSGILVGACINLRLKIETIN